jgi:HAD superfamily hydrolase (TIGR01509 family)
MLLIFDCDGVLVDSETLSCRIDAEILTECGVPYTAEEVARDFTGVSVKDQITRIESERGIRLPEGVRDAILSFPFPRCVASSSIPERIALSLRVTGLLDLFDNVFSSTQVARGKPAPDLFLHAASRMNTLPEECLVIEDSIAGVQAARAAGMRVIGFVGGSHCGPGHAEKLRQAGAPVIIERMSDLPAAVSTSC